ncbi:MAG: hypothetical protein KF873_11150 [Gemmataceae bacterium]|nr:hypothetical protein [Planctomycetia bacterium]MBX3399290.1 hypothetical protein [Gemmataceae bacterium]
MFDFRAFWLRLGYVLGFREEPPKFNLRTTTITSGPADAPPPSEHKASPIDEDWPGRRILTRIIIAGFIGIAFYGFFANASRVLIPLIWALGTLALGTLTGFLFCLPRIRQGEPVERESETADPTKAGDPAKSKRAPRGTDGYGLDINTNLEQISDWLSKIIVGLGLVELRKIPGHMVDLADYIAKDMGDPSARAFACGLVLFFAVCGFLYGYLYMRLILSHRFREADQKSKGLDQQKLDETARKTEGLELFAIINAEIAGIQAELPDAPPHEVDDAIRLLEAARKLQPDRRKTNMLLGVLLAIKKKEYERGIRICEEAIEAMRRSGSLTAKDEADFRYNIACFHMAEANDLPANDARKAELESKAIRILDQAIQIWPGLKSLARTDQQREWNPVRNRPEFQRLVTE